MPLSKPLNESHSDEVLAARLRQGDMLALSMLMERHKNALYRPIWRHVGDEEDAYDLLQETFFRVHQKIHLYKPEHRFKPWLYQIAINLCRDHMRSRSVRRLFWFSEEAHQEAVADTPSPEQHVSAARDFQRVQKAIERLPAKLRTAFILFAIEENSLLDCADILEVTPKTVETRVYRARRLLHAWLAEKP
jgi:RNA polymerase sigma factor (sigma-70 family)